VIDPDAWEHCAASAASYSFQVVEVWCIWRALQLEILLSCLLLSCSVPSYSSFVSDTINMHIQRCKLHKNSRVLKMSRVWKI
jgi:hypothetical protein